VRKLWDPTAIKRRALERSPRPDAQMPRKWRGRIGASAFGRSSAAQR
jgi:hypothetical protein